MIELREISDDAKGLGGGFTFWIGNVSIPRGFTPETGRAAAERFLAICQPHEAELLAMCKEYEERRQWNMDSNGNGKAWPIFNKMEKFLNKLQKQANISDD